MWDWKDKEEMSEYKLINQLGLGVIGRQYDAKGLAEEYLVFADDLEKLLSDATVVFMQKGPPITTSWMTNDNVGPSLTSPTHSALLINVQEIKRECVKHEPILGWDDRFGMTFGREFKCKHCSIPLKAEWKPA